MVRPVRAIGSFLLVLVAACGGGGDDVSVTDGGTPDTPDPPTGAFDSPDDFDHTSCAPGAFTGRDPQGIYHFQIDFQGQLATRAMRFDVLGPGQFGGVLSARDVTTALATADDIFLFQRLDGVTSRSLDLCDVDFTGEMSGHYAFCNEQGCTVSRVTARKVERVAEAASSGLRLLGEHAGAGWGDGLTVNVRVLDKYAYLARYQDGLRIVDISNPAAAVDVGHGPVESIDGSEIYNDVKLITAGVETFAIMGSNRAGAVVWNVTVPASPRIVAHLGTPDELRPPNIHTLFLQGTVAYLANTNLGLEIYDVANPAAPVRLGVFANPTGAADEFLHDLSIRGDRAYLNFWGTGMVIVDVSDPAQPVEVGTFANYGETSSHSNWVTSVGARDIAAHGDEQWGSHLRLVDVTEGSPAFLEQVGEWQLRPEVSAHNIMAFGSTVYVAYYQDGIRMVDISNPAAPQQVAWFNTWPGYDRAYGHSFFEGAVGLDVDELRRRVYVADSHRGLLILSDTRP